MVQREIATATKENRKPMTPEMVSRIHNELCLCLFAGATTTADTLAWGLKELSLRQDFQKKIRDHMRGAHPKQFEEGKQSPASALGRPEHPYLEALMYEVMRRRPISCGHFRIATENTQLLGHDIPKDTETIFAISWFPVLRGRALITDEHLDCRAKFCVSGHTGRRVTAQRDESSERKRSPTQVGSAGPRSIQTRALAG